MELPPPQPPTTSHRRFTDGRTTYTQDKGAEEQQVQLTELSPMGHWSNPTLPGGLRDGEGGRRGPVIAYTYLTLTLAPWLLSLRRQRNSLP